MIVLADRLVSILISTESRSMVTGLVDLNFLYKDLWTRHDHSGFHPGVVKDPLSLPHSFALTSVMSSVLPSITRQKVGLLAAVIPWDLYFSRLLPEGSDGVHVVLEGTCGSKSTYLINGPVATFLGKVVPPKSKDKQSVSCPTSTHTVQF